MGLTISYSIFFNSGRKTKNHYRDGLIRNCKNYKKIFPNSKMVVYHDSSIDTELVKILTKNDVILKKRDDNKNWSGTFWRFEELDNIKSDNDIVIITDADTDINVENQLFKKMVDNIQNHKLFIHHGGPNTSIRKIKEEQRWIIACVAVFKGPLKEKITDKIIPYIKTDKTFGNDERFLRDYVWSQLKEDSLLSIERRSINGLKEIIKKMPNIIPEWMGEENYMDRIFTKWSAK